jgi:NitT/TauT family transport system permease protein
MAQQHRPILGLSPARRDFRQGQVPIFYIWLGDTASIYAMAIAVSVFVTIIMLYTGFNAVDPDKIKLVRLFGASHRQVLWKIVLPASVPTMISTLKVNVGLALVGRHRR